MCPRAALAVGAESGKTAPGGIEDVVPFAARHAIGIAELMENLHGLGIEGRLPHAGDKVVVDGQTICTRAVHRVGEGS